MTDATDGAAVVTGASRGIGRELARVCAREGHDTVLVARSERPLDDLASTLSREYGVRAEPIPMDLAREDAAADLVEAVDKLGLTVSVLVNNAGFSTYGRFTETPLDRELDMLRLMVVTPTALTKRYGIRMAERGQGWMLNVSSIAAVYPIPRAAVYSATKHYLAALSWALSVELADLGVTVTALCPGDTDTGFFEGDGMEQTAFADGDRRLLDPERVARAGYEGLMAGERTVVPGLRDRVRWLVGKLAPTGLTTRGVDRYWRGD